MYPILWKLDVQAVEQLSTEDIKQKGFHTLWFGQETEQSCVSVPKSLPAIYVI